MSDSIYDIALEKHGPASRYSTRAVDSLVEYYDDLGRQDEADRWRAKRPVEQSDD